MNNPYNACNNLSVSTNVSTSSGVARYFKKSVLNELAGVNLRICPADDELKRQKQKEEEKGTCSIGLCGQILHGSITWLDQDNAIALIVVDHVIHHGDFRHGVQLVCKILPKGKQGVVNTQHAYTNEHVHAHSHLFLA